MTTATLEARTLAMLNDGLIQLANAALVMGLNKDQVIEAFEEATKRLHAKAGVPTKRAL